MALPIEAAPDLERLQVLATGRSGSVANQRGWTAGPRHRLETPAQLGAGEARWAVKTARPVIAEFHAATDRELPDCCYRRTRVGLFPGVPSTALKSSDLPH